MIMIVLVDSRRLGPVRAGNMRRKTFSPSFRKNSSKIQEQFGRGSWGTPSLTRQACI